MATIDNNIITKGLRGMIGDIIVFRQVRGKTVLANRPRKPRVQSALQKQNRQLFRRATSFARVAMRDPEKKEYYRNMAGKMRLPNAYTAALTIHLRKIRGLKTDILVDRARVERKAARTGWLRHWSSGSVIADKRKEYKYFYTRLKSNVSATTYESPINNTLTSSVSSTWWPSNQNTSTNASSSPLKVTFVECGGCGEMLRHLTLPSSIINV